jgi:hypothetical protein
VTVEGEIRLPRLVEEGFYRRREITSGHFFGPQYLSKWPPVFLSRLLNRAPGFRARWDRSAREYKIVNTRPGCGEMGVFVDGRRWKGPLDLPGSEVAAVEVYGNYSDAAGSILDRGHCGAIYVWTWKGRNPYQNLTWDDWEEISCPLAGLDRTGC